MSKLEDLIEVLDDGVTMLKRRADVLDQMSECIQNRKVEELESIVADSPAFEKMEEELMGRIRHQCRVLAKQRGMELEQHTLRRLVDDLSGRDAMIVRDLRQRLVFVISQVQDKARHVAEMASRVRQVEERMLMAALGEQNDDTETYDSDGQVARRQHGMALQQHA